MNTVKVSVAIMNHLSDIQSGVLDPKEMNERLNFVKRLILDYPSTTIEVEESELNQKWSENPLKKPFERENKDASEKIKAHLIQLAIDAKLPSDMNDFDTEPIQTILANTPTKQFPNGFASWHKTHFDMIEFMVTEFVNGCSSMSYKLMYDETPDNRYQFIKELTDKFEGETEGIEWIDRSTYDPVLEDMVVNYILKKGDFIKEHLGKEVVVVEETMTPNGLHKWRETYHEIGIWITMQILNNPKSVPCKINEEKGSKGIYDLAEEMTDKFEEQYQGRKWGGEFFDEIQLFCAANMGNT